MSIAKKVFESMEFCLDKKYNKGSFTNYIDTFLDFFDHLPLYVDIIYLI